MHTPEPDQGNHANDTGGHHGSATKPSLKLIQRLLSSLPGKQEIYRSSAAFSALPSLCTWLLTHGLGPIAYARFKDAWPELAEALRGDRYMAALEHTLRRERQARIHLEFAKAGIPIVPLKGAALALTVYDDPAWRPMGDVDYWVRDEQMMAAIEAMQRAGYRPKVSWEERPPALQKLFDGEMQFVGPDRDIVELHWSPFSGWWLQGAARVDNAGLWQRRQPIPPRADDAGDAPQQWQLAPEDTILQLAVHVSVSHKFGIWPVRSLLDIYLVATKHDIDWQALVRRAYEWGLATVLWTVLRLTRELFAWDAIDSVLRALQPSRLRRRLLQRVMPVETFLMNSDLREESLRFALLLLLVDRPLDIIRLTRNMLWPSRTWLTARYGEENPGNLRHLWRILRRGQM